MNAKEEARARARAHSKAKGVLAGLFPTEFNELYVKELEKAGLNPDSRRSTAGLRARIQELELQLKETQGV